MNSSQTNTTLDVASEKYTRQFLRERLGERKYDIFIARLSERRLNGEKAHLVKARAGSRKRNLPADEVAKNSENSASTIDFLVKVEVVKEVLRLFVPFVSFQFSLRVQLTRISF